jgi:phage major head subunit gpT-like protein
MTEKLSIYSRNVRADFNTALHSGIPADVSNAMRAGQVIQAPGARKVNQAWLTPLSDPAQFDGTRHYQQLDHRLSELEVVPYDISHKVRIRDVEDSAVPLWTGVGAEMVRRTRIYPIKRMNAVAAAAASTLSFEGVAAQYMAASTHTVGSGDNLIATTCAAGVSATIIALYIGGPIKPLLWYEKKQPLMGENDSADRSESGWAKEWVDFEGVAGPGFWWDMVDNVCTGLPTVAEFQTALGEIIAAFRSFTYPGGDYVHELSVFGGKTLLLMIPSRLEAIARRVREDATIASSDNEYAGSFDFMVNTNLA